jgi:hypothetical protein
MKDFSMAQATLPELPLVRPASAPLTPPPDYARLRAERPITRVSLWGGKLDPWLVTRYEDARAVLSSTAFSTDPSPRPGMPDFPSVREGQLQTPRGFFQSYDPPVHTTMRRTLTREFMVKRIEALRPGIKRLTGELLEAMTEQSAPVDLVEHFSLPLPSLVICDLLGVPYEDHEFFQKQAKCFVDLTSTPEDIVQAQKELGGYLDQLIERKRKEPGEDVVTRLTEHVDAGTVSARDAADLAAFVLFAGHETTANMIALSTITLLQNPDQIPALLAGSPADVGNAVEELLRYLTIVHSGLRRYAIEDVEIGGVTIRAGDGVIVPIGAANHDPEVFADPDRLDLGRANARRHVAFGYGIHQCLGQPLARVELQIVMPELFRRLPNLRITVPLEELVFKNAAVYGVQSLPVTW